MDSLKFHSGPPCLTLLRLAGWPPLKQPYSCFRGSRPTGWAGGLQPSSTLLDTPRDTPMVIHTICVILIFSCKKKKTCEKGTNKKGRHYQPLTSLTSGSHSSLRSEDQKGFSIIILTVVVLVVIIIIHVVVIVFPSPNKSRPSPLWARVRSNQEKMIELFFCLIFNSKSRGDYSCPV
jgi:hypothetical protein